MKNKKSNGNKKKNTVSPVVEVLITLLADTYVLYTKTQNFHWNVSGPLFFTYHQAFENQYEQLSDAVDVLAERIRALGEKTPASLAQFLKITSLNEADENLKANEMLQTLLLDHELLAFNIENAFEIMDESGDEVTMDILIQRKTEHDKTAWMLRSTLGQS